MKKTIAALMVFVISALLALCGCSPSSTAATGDEAPESTAPTPAAVETPELPEPTDSPEPHSSADVSSEDEYTSEELTGIADPSDILPSLESYDEAVALNEDVVGWITIPGTVIDYPVVRCDNNEYYLGRNVKKEKSRYGAIFMDFRNADEAQQKHIILYGHNMKNGTMFHDLMNYKQKDFFDENRYIYFMWDGTETVWQIFLATIVPSYEGFSINYIETRFSGDDNFADYMAEMKAYAGTVSPSIVDGTITILPSDQVLTLSTCTYEYDNSRFAVQARRVK